jgi:hypothetical protein
LETSDPEALGVSITETATFRGVPREEDFQDRGQAFGRVLGHLESQPDIVRRVGRRFVHGDGLLLARLERTSLCCHDIRGRMIIGRSASIRRSRSILGCSIAFWLPHVA